MNELKKKSIRQAVRDSYGKIAESRTPSRNCPGDGCCGSSNSDSAEGISLALGYSGEEVQAVPGSETGRKAGAIGLCGICHSS